MSGGARLLFCLVLVPPLAIVAAEPSASSRCRGTPLVEILERLKASGANLIYSDAVVGPDLCVAIEPRATEPRAVLDEILPALGLEVREAPGGALLVVPSSSGAPGRLHGRVVSAGLGRPIGLASIHVPETALTTLTRPDGTFEILRVPPGTHAVTIVAPGFTELTLGAVRIPPGGSTRLSLRLEARSTLVEQLVVTPGRHAIVREEQASSTLLRADDAVLVPTIGGDVSRIVELLPGVTSADNSAAFNVRGSETGDVSMVLDGLELYAPFHLQSFQSPFSHVDAKIVDSIEFLAGGFTAELGDRHGGFVRLATAPPEDPYPTAVELGTLNSRVTWGKPSTSGSLLASARAWYPEALRDTIELGETGLDPRFADGYFKYTRNLSTHTVLSAHALVAFDELEFVEPDGNERVQADSRSGYLWLRALRSWSPEVSTETSAWAGRLERTRSGVSEPEDVPFAVDDERSVELFGLRQDVTWAMSAERLLRGGFEVRPLEGQYRYRTTGEDATTIDLDPSGTSIGAYAAFRAALSPALATEIGLRWDRQTYTRDDQLSPRLHAIWRTGPRSELRVGLGRFSQSQRIHELAVEDGQTAFAPAERSRQAELTFRHDFTNGLGLRLDAYERRVEEVQPRWENMFNPLELFVETEADRIEIAPEQVRSRGVELRLRGDPRRPLYWWASYVWSSAEDVIDGTPVPRSWDQPHTGKFLVAYRARPGWAVSLAGTLHTGWPTTPVSGEIVSDPGEPVEIEPLLGARNSDRFPNYVRLDLKASRSIALRRSLLRFELEIVNLTDRDNICCIDEFAFTPLPDGSVAVAPELGYWLGITPSFSALWAF